MHQVAEIMEEGDDIAILHQPRFTRFATREVTDQGCFRELTAGNTGNQRRRAKPLVFALARVHVQVEPADLPAAVVNLPCSHRGVPSRSILGMLESDLK